MYERLNALLKGSHFTKKRIAQHLFPDKRYSYQALVRVLSGKGEFSATQMKQLAELLGVTISELYGEKPKRNWRLSYIDQGLFQFISEGYRATLRISEKEEGPFSETLNLYSLANGHPIESRTGLKAKLTFSQLTDSLEQMITEHETRNS